MKSTGIVRRVDELGRIVLPIELRRTLDIKSGKEAGQKNGDPMEIYLEGEIIILKKHQPSCIFCGEYLGTEDFKGKKICKKCRDEIKNI